MGAYASSGIGYDLSFEMNEFQEQRICSDLETLKNVLLFIIFTKPGQYPSIPQIGLNIKDELYTNYDEFDVNNFRTQLIEQCALLDAYITDGTISIKKVMYRNTPSLIIRLEGTANLPSAYKVPKASNTKYYIGLTYDDMKNMIYNVNAQ